MLRTLSFDSWGPVRRLSRMEALLLAVATSDPMEMAMQRSHPQLEHSGRAAPQSNRHRNPSILPRTGRTQCFAMGAHVNHSEAGSAGTPVLKGPKGKYCVNFTRGT